MTPIVVLLVEDSAAIRALVRRMLVPGGHSVVAAAGGAAALAACREQHPDVVLLDVEMPEMSGWEVLAAMKADADLRDVPVMFLTGRSDTTDTPPPRARPSWPNDCGGSSPTSPAAWATAARSG